MSQVCRAFYLLGALLAVTLITGSLWRMPKAATFASLSENAVPRVMDGFTGRDYAMDAASRQTLGSASVLCRTYGAGRDAIDFVMIAGQDRSAVHDPRNCMTGSGMLMVNQRSERLPNTDVDVMACQAVGHGDPVGYDVLYLYVVNGKRISGIAQIRMQMLWGALIGSQAEHVYFLRFLQARAKDPAAQAQRHQQLLRFASDMWRTLQPEIVKNLATQKT